MTIRRVPDALLSQLSASAPAEAEGFTAVLRRRYRIPAKLAEEIVRERPANRADILRNRAVLSAGTRDELFALFRTPRSELPRAPLAIASAASLVHYTGLLLGELTLRERTSPRYGLSDAEGELASAELAASGKLDYGTVRFLGHAPWQLQNLDTSTRLRLHARLHRVSRQDLGAVLRGEGLDTQLPGARSYRTLAGMLALLQHFTRVYAVDTMALSASLGTGVESGTGTLAGGNPLGDPGVIDQPDPVTPPASGDDCTEANGCGPEAGDLGSLVPDFNFGGCCDAHDRCYCRGCSACDRLDCDNALYDCILARTSLPEVALLYYTAVRAFGNLGPFNTCGDPVGVGGLVATVAGVGLAAGVGWMVSLAGGGALGGVAVGAVLAGLAIWLASEVLCHACEVVTRWIEDAEEWVEQELRRQTELRKKRMKKCRKKKHWWQRAWCRFTTWMKYIIIVLIVLLIWVIVEIVLRPIDVLIC